jgi:RimJ/RimL family protein N-acetyltransferase
LLLSPVGEQDLPYVLKVFQSNPRYLEWTEEGEYGPDELRGDWESARDAEGRHLLALRDRDTSEILGVIEYVENNPSDGHPWIGLIMVASGHHRKGLAGEAMQAVCDHVHLNWASPVRMGVIEENQAGIALAISLGFQPYGEAFQYLGGEERHLVLLQRRL